MRAVFFGSPDIAVPALEALCAIAEVAGVACQPDRPAGRGLELRPPAVKVRALELGLEVVQPEKLRSGPFPEWVRARDADVALVMAYGRILPPVVLEAPRRGCINLHASLLPRYRGAAPINWAVARGETETGISLMQMDEGCDTGPVFVREALGIRPDETAGELGERLAALAAAVVRGHLPAAVRGELVAEAQDETLCTVAPKLSKDDGLLDFSRPAPDVHNRARGMSPWPGACCYLGGKRLKLLQTRLAGVGGTGLPGRIVALDEHGATVACGEGAILLVRAQIEGKKPLHVAQMAAGRTLGVGMTLENHADAT
ncbi:MAG: methionyl-tRNA formyltransferase [Deltaproteobacteria bacterium]|nr:methionyl-tRNA formyltransferase [Deltaproteobacteria bacterium]